MHRISSATKAIDLHGAGKHGFKDGNRQLGVQATEFTADWCNTLQEELSHIVESASIALDKPDNTQVLTAIQAHIYDGLINGFANSNFNDPGYIQFPNGFKIQWVSGLSVNGEMLLTHPIAFDSLLLGGIAGENAASGWLQATWVTTWGYDYPNSSLTQSRVFVRATVEDGPPQPLSNVSGRVLVWGI